MTDNDLKELLDAEAQRINSVDFVAEDPVPFLRSARHRDRRPAQFDDRLGQTFHDMPQCRQDARPDGQPALPLCDGRGL